MANIQVTGKVSPETKELLRNLRDQHGLSSEGAVIEWLAKFHLKQQGQTPAPQGKAIQPEAQNSDTQFIACINPSGRNMIAGFRDFMYERHSYEEEQVFPGLPEEHQPSS